MLKQVTAKKAHSCINCGQPINKGDPYLYEGGRAKINAASGAFIGFAYWNIKKHLNKCKPP